MLHVIAVVQHHECALGDVIRAIDDAFVVHVREGGANLTVTCTFSPAGTRHGTVLNSEGSIPARADLASVVSRPRPSCGVDASTSKIWNGSEHVRLNPISSAASFARVTDRKYDASERSAHASHAYANRFAGSSAVKRGVNALA